MKVRLKSNLIVVSAETPEERESLATWAAGADGHVFALKLQDGQTFRLTDLGPRAEACREPINVTSRSPDPAVQLISNFAHTPFEMDGRRYASVEAFWQGLKWSEERRRREVAELHGMEARNAGREAPEADALQYEGKRVRIGTADHWRLMAAACWMKFNQHDGAKQALLGTGDRPLVHVTRKDSRTIPGIVMADIWMKVRRGLVKRQEPAEELESEAEDVS